jgi:Rha family phage regulatory protein
MSNTHNRSAEALPALCAELGLKGDGGVPVVNSRDVAAAFEKRHDHVLRDINALNISPDLGRSWLRPATSLDSYGREQPSFDMTRDGFTLLVMGWTGERAMQFKVRYIQAFNAMEDALKDRGVTASDLIQAVREIVAPLAVRFDSQDGAIARIEARQDSMAEDLALVKRALINPRRNLTQATKREHIASAAELGGRCPCCGLAAVVTEEGDRSAFAEFDHFYHNSKPDADHTWLICKPCHQEMTTGRVPRDQREAVFRAYQDQRHRLPGRQISLF